MQMKQYFPVILKQMLIPHLTVAILFCCQAMAADVRIDWDAPAAGQTWVSVRIYERTGAAPNFTYVKVGETSNGTVTSITLTGIVPGTHTFVARAYNIWESADSNSVLTPVVPNAPTVKTVTVIIP